MKKSSLAKYALIGACLPLFAGCVQREVVYRDRRPPPPVVVAPAPPPPVYVAPAPPPPVVVEAEPPPPPPIRVEVQTAAPGPLSLWFWAPGAWEWNGRWVWTRGHWVSRPRPGAIWYGPRWDYRGGHRIWVHGYWR